MRADVDQDIAWTPAGSLARRLGIADAMTSKRGVDIMNRSLLGRFFVVAFTGMTTLAGVASTASAAPVPFHRGEVAQHVVVRDRPPMDRREVIGARPSPRHVWIPGRWTYDHDRYTWGAGYWTLPPHDGGVWVPGHWVDRDGGWFWAEGHWA